MIWCLNWIEFGNWWKKIVYFKKNCSQAWKSLTVLCFFWFHFNNLSSRCGLSWNRRRDRYNNCTIRTSKTRIAMTSVGICTNLKKNISHFSCFYGKIQLTYSLTITFDIVAVGWTFSLIDVWEKANTGLIYTNQIFSARCAITN